MMALLLHWAVYLLTLAGLCAFAVNYTAWFSSFLFYAVLFLPLFSLLLSLWPYFALHLSFSAPMQVHRGDLADLKITVNAKGCPYYLPLLMTVFQTDLSHAENSPANAIRCKFAPYPIVVHDKQHRNRLVIRAAGGVRVPIPTQHTAVIRTEIRSAYMWDFLGLFRFRMHLVRNGTFRDPLRTDITVLPHASPPRGKLQMWDNSQSTLVPTQRLSEQYEIRTYRPGDALRSVHWKLTAKIDDILVRESVEPRYSVLAIALERVPDAEMADTLYDALDWMLRALCVRDRVSAVIVGWVTSDGRTCTETLYDLSRLDDFYRRMLSDAVPEHRPSHAFAALYKTVDRGYHLDIDTCLGTAEAVTVVTAGNEPHNTELSV